MTNPLESRFVFVDGIAVARLEGRMTLQQAIRWIGETLAGARLFQYRRVMLVVTAADGFEVPSLAQRVEMIRGWADAAAGEVGMALVCRPEYIDPEKFGVKVAAGFGMNADVFDAEDAALAWLREMP